MKISDQLKELMQKNNVNVTQLAMHINTSQPNVTSKLARDNFKLSDIKEIAEGLGYDSVELVLRKNNETVIIRENKPITVTSGTYLIEQDNHKDVVFDKSEYSNFNKNSTKKLDTQTYIEQINALCLSSQISPYTNIIHSIIKSLYIAQTGYDSIIAAHKAAPDLFGVEDTIPIYETCEQEVLKALEHHLDSNTYKGFLTEYLEWKNGVISTKED